MARGHGLPAPPVGRARREGARRDGLRCAGGQLLGKGRSRDWGRPLLSGSSRAFRALRGEYEGEDTGKLGL